MLFNSFQFIFVFLPVVLGGFYFFTQQGKRDAGLYWLVVASLFFYGWWRPVYLWLIIGSVLFNYSIGHLLTQKTLARHWRKLALVIGISVNLASIGYFKYANFFVGNLNAVLGVNYHLDNILLPLAISFFTFQQIAYLVDAWRGETEEHSFRNYALFVTFFPQLIAGPIVHHKEMLPQFMQPDANRFSSHNLVVGLTIFTFGLFKKVVLADGVAPYADSVFALANTGEPVYFLEAWTGAIAYTLQLYFDFSGYSDMAIGIARMFGITLPVNFNSPYKALNIIDFWRRWHITLSRFLRDYLYFPLGGNRKGPTRRHVNLMTTMLLGGLWHGAGWTFVIWGGLHGLYLVINHAWRGLRQRLGQDIDRSTLPGRTAARTLTLLCVIVAWVYFRAENLHSAHQILAGMAGVNGISLPASWADKSEQLTQLLTGIGVTFQQAPATLGSLFPPFLDLMVMLGFEVEHTGVGAITALVSMLMPVAIALFMPNTQQMMRREKPVLEIGSIPPTTPILAIIAWRKTVVWASLTAMLAAYASFGAVGTSQFLYFNF